MNENEEFYCPILKSDIPEMECYETCNGCMDTIIHARSLLSTPQIKEICQQCEHSNFN